MKAHIWRGKHGSLVRIERSGGSNVRGDGSPIDDFISDAHHGIKVADIALRTPSEQARCEGKAAGVAGDDLSRSAITHSVVAAQVLGRWLR